MKFDEECQMVEGFAQGHMLFRGLYRILKVFPIEKTNRDNMDMRESITKNEIMAPRSSLSKVGSAIKGIGKTFQPDTFSCTGSFSIPICTNLSKCFEPGRTFSYKPVSGIDIFSMRLSHLLTTISRKTSKGGKTKWLYVK